MPFRKKITIININKTTHITQQNGDDAEADDVAGSFAESGVHAKKAASRVAQYTRCRCIVIANMAGMISKCMDAE